MESLYRIPFLILECPRLKLKKPALITWPSPMLVFTIVLLGYFLITGVRFIVANWIILAWSETKNYMRMDGVIYDMIVGPPSMGTTSDAKGNQKPVAIFVWRLNNQYILEGLAASFMFLMGSFGFIVMDKVNEARVSKLNRILLLALGIGCIIASILTLRVFIKTKLPSYMG